MELLDDLENSFALKKSNRYLLLFLALSCLLMQLDGIYNQYHFNRMSYGLFMCFWNPYGYQFLVQLFAMIGLTFSSCLWIKNNWGIPQNTWDRIALVSPLVVLAFDQLLVWFILGNL